MALARLRSRAVLPGAHVPGMMKLMSTPSTSMLARRPSELVCWMPSAMGLTARFCTRPSSAPLAPAPRVAADSSGLCPATRL